MLRSELIYQAKAAKKGLDAPADSSSKKRSASELDGAAEDAPVENGDKKKKKKKRESVA